MDTIIKKISALSKEAMSSLECYFLTAVSVGANKKLKAYLRGQEPIVVDTSCFNTFDKAVEACKKYVNDFCNAGYSIIETCFDEQGKYVMYLLHKGKDIEHIEITSRKLNCDTCGDYYFEDKEGK